MPYQGIDFTEIGDKQREFNLARLAILRRMLAGEITKEQADIEGAEVSKRFPEFSSPKPLSEEEYESKMNELYAEPTDVHGEIGYRRSSEENKIPPAAKAVMKHRTACGVKLSDSDLARFWSKINVKGANECWPWAKSLRGSLGYGQFRIGDKICDAHRIALELGKGPLKKGRYVCHSCDSPKCCNPKHLFAGTQKNNMDDMTEKGRGDN